MIRSLLQQLPKRYVVWIMRSIPNVFWPLKVWLMKRSLRRVGSNFRCGPNCSLSDHRLIEVGDDVFIGDGSVIGVSVPIQIGDGVMFGPEVMVRGGDHNFLEVGSPMRNVKTGGINLPISIESDVWVGARTIILKGVQIGEGAVVGAGSVVNKSILPYTINVGVPCKPVRCRFTEKELRLHLERVNSRYSMEEISEAYRGLGVDWRKVEGQQHA